MWIRKLEIENFRNYKGKVSFDLNKQITILYGDNGFGKSSFFDAIEWGLTGAIGRFEQNDNDKDFDNIDLINEDALKQDGSICSITLYFGDYTLKRHFSSAGNKTNNTYVELKNISLENGAGDQTIHGKVNVDSALRAIFMPNINDKTLDIKQPFILSQDQVTDFVLKDKPKQRYKALANLVGLDKIIKYSDNMRLVIKELNSRSKEFNEIVMKNQAVIDSYSTHKSVSIEEIIADVKEISLRKPHQQEDYQAVIDEARYINNSNIVSTKKQLDLMARYELRENLTPEMMVSTKSDLKAAFNRIENHISEVNGFIKKLKNKLSQLEKDELNRKKLNNLLQQQEDLGKQIQSKRNEIENLELMSIDRINDLDDHIERVSSKIEAHNYHLLYYEDFYKMVEQNLGISLKVTSTTILLDSLKRRKKRKEKWINKISAWILDNSENSSQIKLHELLKEVNDYLTLTKENSICPVCSTDKNGKLNEISSQNLLTATNLLQKQTLKAKQVLELKLRVKNNHSKINNEIRNLEDELYSLNTIITKNNDELKRIKNSDNFNISLMEKKREELLEEVKELNEQYGKMNRWKTYNIQLIELERRDSVLKESLKQVNQLIISNHPNVLHLYRELYRKRENYLESIKLKHSKVNSEYDTITLEINMLIENGVTIDDVPFSEKCLSLEGTLGELRNKLKLIDNLNNKYSEFKGTERLDISIRDAKKEIQRAKERLGYIHTNVNLISTYIDELNEKVGSEAINFLNQENSSVQQLYRYLNPMLNSKRLKFIAEEEELSIKVTSEIDSGLDKETSAKYVLSSGQLNVLALSIFLSVNDAMDSELNIVAIDDPIQNMDDVNQFSICDILSNLRRQLIFSTHDLDFVKLFVKKNEYLNGAIQVYMLKQPVITSEESYEQIVF